MNSRTRAECIQRSAAVLNMASIVAHSETCNPTVAVVFSFLRIAEMYGERLFFTYPGSDGVERELSHGGAARRVTFDNRLTFCRMVEDARTHEFDAQVGHGLTVGRVFFSLPPFPCVQALGKFQRAHL